MTFVELQTAVSKIVKVPLTSEVADLINIGLSLVWSDFVQTRKIDDQIKNRVNLSLTGIIAAKGEVKIGPINTVVDIKEVRFASGSDEWTLQDEEGRIPPAPIQGKPRAWRYIGNDPANTAAGDRLYIEPFAGITEVSDKLYITYWKYYSFLAATNDATHVNDTVLATTKWDTELVDRAAAYVFMEQKKLDSATLLLAKYKAPAQPQQQSTQ